MGSCIYCNVEGCAYCYNGLCTRGDINIERTEVQDAPVCTDYKELQDDC